MATKNRKLTIKTSFEPNRFKTDCLISAYEIVLPIIKHRIDLENESKEFCLFKLAKIQNNR